MNRNKNFDAIIIGGSYAGLSAGMALGRSLRNVLIIDAGNPCNKQTPHSHNFITHDGEKPAVIAAKAKQQVEAYETVSFVNGFATKAKQTTRGFDVTIDDGDTFSTSKLIIASGVKDKMPDIEGFAACWGISVIHCPYCHGYEVRNEKTGILSNGDMAFEFGKMITNWTKDLTIFTNGKSTLTEEQTTILKQHGVDFNEQVITKIEHTDGHLDQLIFDDGTKMHLKALYAKIPFAQHSDLPQQLGCVLNEHGLIQVDAFQRTSVGGVYACGDSVTMMRSVASAVATGNLAGAICNREMIEAQF